MAGPKGKPAAGAGSDEMKFITMKVVGGEPPSNAVLSAKLAPFGCNPKKAGETISKGTQEYMLNYRFNLVKLKMLKLSQLAQHI